MNAPWLDLYNFLANAPQDEILSFSQAGPDFAPQKWEHDLKKYNCLNYVLDSKEKQNPWLNSKPVPLFLKWKGNETDKPIEEQCRDTQSRVEKSFIHMRYAYFPKMECTIRQDIPALIDELEATPIFKPEDLNSNQYLASYGLTNHYGDGHFARLDRDGKWSEKPGVTAVKKHKTSNPYDKEACSSFTPILFFALES